MAEEGSSTKRLEDLSNVPLNKLSEHVDSDSKRCRLSLVDQLLNHADDHEGSTETEAQAFCKAALKIMFRTIQLWEDGESTAAVEDAIASLMENAALRSAFMALFSKGLCDMIQHVCPAKPKAGSTPCSPKVATKLLRWSLIFLQSTGKDAEAMPWLKDLLKRQCTLIQLGVATTRESSLVRRCLSNNRFLWKVYVEIVNSSNPKLFHVISLLLQCATEEAEMKAEWTDSKSVFLKWYDKEVLCCGKKLSKATRNCFQALYPTLNHDDMKALLLPSILRMFKRSPEFVCANLAALLEHVTFDLSRYVKDFFPTVEQELKSSDGHRRQMAVLIVRALCHKSSDPAVLEFMHTELSANLLGKKGVLGQLPLRVAFVSALQSLTEADSAGSACMSAMAKVAVPNIVEFLGKEKNANVKAIGVTLLGKWCLIQRNVPAPVIKLFLAGLAPPKAAGGKADPLAAAYIRSAQKLSALKGLKESINSCWPALLGHIKAAIDKPPTCRVAGMLAVALLATTACSNARDTNKEHLEWVKEAASGSSFINDPELVQKSGVEAVAAQIQLFQAVLAVADVDFDRSALYHAMVLLALSPESKIRGRVHKALADAAKKDMTVACGLIQALHKIAFEGSSDVSPAIVVEVCPLLGGSVAPQPVLHLLSQIALGVCEEQKQADQSVWQQLCEGWASSSKFDLESSLQSKKDDFTNLVLGDAGILSKQNKQRVAGTKTMGMIANSAPDLFDVLLSGLVELVKDSPLATATPYEEAVYNTPEGTICTWQESGTYVSDSTTKVQRKRPKGSLYSAEDEDWAAEIEDKKRDKPKGKGKGKAAKGGKAGKAEQKKDPIVEAKLKDEVRIRNTLADAFVKVEAGLDAIKGLVSHSPQVARDYVLPTVLPIVEALMNSGLVGELARETHAKLGACLGGCFAEGSVAELTISALQSAVQHGQKVWKQEESSDAIVSCLSEISNACAKNQLSAPALVFCLPVLRLSILHSADAHMRPGLKQAFEIIRRHCSPELNADVDVLYPTSDIITLLLTVLANVSSLKSASTDALLDICAGLTADETTVLLGEKGVLAGSKDVRLACLEALEQIPDVNQPVNRQLVARVWTLSYDEEDEIAEVACEVWETLEMSVEEDFCELLIPVLSSSVPTIRNSTALAIAAGLGEQPELTELTVDRLLDNFLESPDTVVAAQRGLAIGTQRSVYKWPYRVGIAKALGACVENLETDSLLLRVFEFIVQHGLRDSNDQVWEAVLESGLKVINVHGSAHLQTFLSFMEERMDETERIAKTDANTADRIREGCVVFMGTLAQHMTPDDPKVLEVVELMLEVLKTPSHSVQKSVSDCLPALMPMAVVKEQAASLIATLLDRLSQSDSYGERMGGAFGLAGMVKGLKLSALKKFGILDALAEHVQNKSSAKAREGALLAYERLFSILGAKFEPYVVNVLPHLLLCFGDSSPDVRAAADQASQVIMSHLTGHGVKMVMPIVLSGLDVKQWRTKLEAIGLLGSMAYCAPRQLSACLPQIVPRLLQVGTDPHKQVQSAAKKALKQIGSVIRNPEIRLLVPQLLAALGDPVNTKSALEELMRTSFVHSVDPPSLALIIPILRRGLRDRVPNTKKMAAQVVGSICSLTMDIKDLAPYSPTLLKRLLAIVVDPIPEVRSVASRALGALFDGIGNDTMVGEGDDEKDLVQHLITVLSAEGSTSVQRSGSAQALAQVLKVLGPDRTAEILPEAYEQARGAASPAVREGFMGLFVFLPEAFSDEMSAFLEGIFPVVLDGFDDEIVGVRDVALRAGQEIVLKFSTSELETLLPPLVEGLESESWQIRLSSVQLIGTLLLRLAGATGKLFISESGTEDGEDSDTAVASKLQETIVEKALGTERRNNIFAAIYLMRSDVVIAVQQMSWRVWKGVVHNTPRMMGQVLPVLVNQIIVDFASRSLEKQHCAGSALGDLVSKMGDAALQEIVPLLQERLRSPEAVVRQGVCLAFAEVMSSARKSHITAYMVDIIPSIKAALCDPIMEVREAAGSAFVTLHKNVGNKAIDEVVPTLLETLGELGSLEVEEESEEAEFRDQQVHSVIEGLRQILLICNKECLPYLIPALVKDPMTYFHARALSSLSETFGSSFHRYVHQVTCALVKGIQNADPATRPKMEEASGLVMLCIPQESVHTLVDILTDDLDDTQPSEVRSASAKLLCAFCVGTERSYDSHVSGIIEALLGLYASDDEDLLAVASASLKGVLTTVDSDLLMDELEGIRKVISNMAFDDMGDRVKESLPGLCQKKGLEPLLPVFQYGLMHGMSDVRTHAAAGLGELIDLSSKKSLRLYLTKIAGPLIRIVGDRFPSEVKLAILHTLGLLLFKAGDLLKPFLPQLQTTFMKAIRDSNELVREESVLALSGLMRYSRRLDPFVNELGTSIASEEDYGVRVSMLKALCGVLEQKAVGKKVSEGVIATVAQVVHDDIAHSDDDVRSAAAKCDGTVAQYLSEGEMIEKIDDLAQTSPDWRERDGKCTALCSLVSQVENIAPDKLEVVASFAAELVKDDNIRVRVSAIDLCSALMTVGVVGKALECVADSTRSDVVQVAKQAFESLDDFVQDAQNQDLQAHKAVLLSACLVENLSNGQLRRHAKNIIERVFEGSQETASEYSASLPAAEKELFDELRG